MKSVPLVSVIMPVYNSERYLNKSVKSVLNQSLNAIELICVNDCSKDGSLAFLKNINKKDSRIKIINNRVNVGPGKSRNIAIKKARGKYLCFLDSDDWLERNACEILYNKANIGNFDIVYVKPKLIFKNKVILDKRLLSKSNISDNDIIFRKNLMRKVAWAPWSKFIKKDLVLKNNIFFPNIYVAEDMDFSYRVIYYADKISCVENYLYNYNLRENSLMAYTNPKRRIDNYFEGIKMLRRFLKDKNLLKKYRREFIYFKLYNYSAIYGVMYYSKDEINKIGYSKKIKADADFKIFNILRLGFFDSVIVAAVLIKIGFFNPAFKTREIFRNLFGKWGKRNN